MKKKFFFKYFPATKLLRRLLVALLCLNILAGAICNTFVFTVQAKEPDTQNTETREEIKTRLMKQIRAGEWDPYSADMSLDEFYALMELFDEGELPLQNSAPSSRPNAKPAIGANPMDGPSIEEPGVEGPGTEELLCIPRTMFMFRGLPLDGTVEYQEGDAPIRYNTDTGYEGDLYNYPAGLDNYGAGYQVPPTSWQGVPFETGKSQVIIANEGENDGNESISSNIVQSLFKDYMSYGYYVRRVTVESTDFVVLGAIKLPNENDYVYYYLTDKNQNVEVSTTKLEDGKKFIIEYSPIEHTIKYEVHMDELGGENVTDKPTVANVLGTELNDIWENIIFGTSHLDKTDGSAYSFTAYAPYGYTVEFYLVRTKDEETGSGGTEWGDPELLLGMNAAGSFTDVNNGWALGKEPDYINGTKNGASIVPSSNGPSTLTMSGNIFNNGVHHDRKIIAVVHANENPSFLVAPLKHNTNNVSNRGTSAYTQVKTIDGQLVPYDYEDVYLWATNQPSRYQYDENDPTIKGAGKGNISKGNVATVDSWQWQNKAPYNDKVEMTKEADGTWSYQWTWQTNVDSGGYTLDSLEVNGVAVTIPFFPKRSLRSDYVTGTTGGNSVWRTEADIGNGIHILVELLMVFNPDGSAQRVYRITATGARSNVTISAMNLIQGTGAPEFVTYQLTGVNDSNGLTAVEYYSKLDTWISTLQGNINVNDDDDAIKFNGNDASYGANIRFKLTVGYTSPYFFWESTRAGVINDQASARRDENGDVILSDLNQVISLENVTGTIGSSNVYGPDDEGWYYIRITTQGDYKIALLTIGAKQLRYVVRYIPETEEVPAPEGMPRFDHTDEPDFQIPQEIADQYDTANGSYYDVAVDNVIILPENIPTDPNSDYKFVDWVLVNMEGKPVKDKRTGQEFHFRITHINLLDVIEYAFANSDLGGEATDIYVLRLMPKWEPIANPFKYTIALNWVDALGNVRVELFENWGSSLTDWDIAKNGSLAVKVFKDAAPFKAWLREHPTYSFWDDVNNAIDDADVAKALDDYVKYIDGISSGDSNYQTILQALTNMDYGGRTDTPSGADASSRISTYAQNTAVKNGEDDYSRNGDYSFSVKENEGFIAIWMYEDKGYIAITETGGKPNENFLYRITDENGNELTVTVKGNGVTYVLAPLGEYTVEEIPRWAWRYEEGVCDQSNVDPKDNTANVTVTGSNNTPAVAIHADFTNEPNDKAWLGGENSKDNRFPG